MPRSMSRLSPGATIYHVIQTLHLMIPILTILIYPINRRARINQIRMTSHLEINLPDHHHSRRGQTNRNTGMTMAQ